MTRWWLPWPPSALHHHQQVLVTRWTVPPASFRLPTTTNESRRLVGRFPGLHLPFHHHQQCSLGFHQGGGDLIVYFCRVFPRLPSGGFKIKKKKILYIYIHLKALNLRL